MYSCSFVTVCQVPWDNLLLTVEIWHRCPLYPSLLGTECLNSAQRRYPSPILVVGHSIDITLSSNISFSFSGGLNSMS